MNLCGEYDRRCREVLERMLGNGEQSASSSVGVERRDALGSDRGIRRAERWKGYEGYRDSSLLSRKVGDNKAASGEQVQKMSPLEAAEVLVDCKELAGAELNMAERQHECGCVLMKASEKEVAIGCFERAIKLYRTQEYKNDRSLMLALSCIAECLVDVGRASEAWAYLEEAIELDPSSAVARKDLGAFLYVQGDYQGAIRYFDESIEVGGEKDAEYYYRVGRSYFMLGDREKAKSVYLASDLESGEWTPTFGQLGLILLEEGDRPEALKYLAKAKKILDDPRCSTVSRGNGVTDADIALVALMAQRWEMTLEYCQKALKKHRRNRELLNAKQYAQRMIREGK